MATMWTSADEAAQQGFDSNYYLTEKAIQLTATTGQTWTVESTAAALEAAGLEPYQHYQLYGYNEGLAPNAYFDSDYYVASKAAAAGVTTDEFLSSWNAISGGASVYFHYIEYGAYENDVNPSSSFGDYQYYVEKANQLNDGTTWQEVREIFQANGLTAISHYMLYGASEGLSPVPVGGATYSLTTSQDVQTANVFNSVPAWSPGGNELVNTLQNFDVLTGTGTNPTLNVQLGDANDSSSTTITPTLNGIETINAAFIGSTLGNAVNTLDMQDATGANSLNITRISDGNSAFFRNITSVPAELSLSNTNSPAGSVGFVMTDAAVAGDDDSTTMTLNNATVSSLLIEGTTEGTTAGSGVETINLVSSTSANAVGTLRVDDIKVLNISGDQNLTIGDYQNPGTGIVYGVDDGDFTTINGADATGNLTLTLNDNLNAAFVATKGTGPEVDFHLTTGSGDDTLYVTTTSAVNGGLAGNTNDVVDLGTGNDTVAFRGAVDNVFTDSTVGNVSAMFYGVENATITRTDDTTTASTDLTVDSTQLDGDQAFTMTNSAEENDDPASFILKNLSATEATSLTITHSSSTNNAVGDTVVEANLADATGTTDTVGLTIVDGLNADPRFNVTLTAANVENITLTDSDTESNSVALTDFAQHTGTITMTGGRVGDFMNLDVTANGYSLDTSGDDAADPTVTDSAVSNVFTSKAAAGELLVASAIDATSSVDNVIVRVGTANQTIDFGSGDDTVIFADRTGTTKSSAGLTIADHVSGGAGTDTIILDGAGTQSVGASEWTNLSGIDTIRLAGQGGSTFNVRVNDHLIDQTDSTSLLNIVNNDGLLDTNSENIANIDLRGLSTTNSVNFVGANGDGTNLTATLAAQTILIDDAGADGRNILNGGDNDITTTYTNDAAGDALWNQNYTTLATKVDGNNNVYAVYNTADVLTGDLANTQNFGTIEFHNTLAVDQTLTLTLDSATVDNLADASHTATTTQVETLNILVSQDSGSAAILNLDASAVGAQFSLNIGNSSGADTIVGGQGIDTVSYADSTDKVTVNLSTNVNTGGWAEGDSLTGIENIIGSAYDDTITGDIHDNVITGGAGADTIDGGAGNNTASYSTSSDPNGVTVDLTLAGAQVSDGDANGDILVNIANIIGSDFNDKLTGDTNSNVITGGAGADQMTGGTGNDVFNYGTLATVAAQTGITVATADEITDFTTNVDEIKTGLAGTAANYSDDGGAPALDFAAAKLAADAVLNGGDIKYYMTSVGGNGLLFIDTDPTTAGAEAVIQLTGVDSAHFASSDIVA